MAASGESTLAPAAAVPTTPHCLQPILLIHSNCVSSLLSYLTVILYLIHWNAERKLNPGSFTDSS